MPPTLEKPKVRQFRDNWDYAPICRQCTGPLTPISALRINDPRNPDDDEPLCLKCGKLKPDIEEQGYEGMAFISGALLVGLIVVLIKWLT